MNIKLKPSKVLNAAYRKHDITRNDINSFKTLLTECLAHIQINEAKKETEEHMKKPISAFLEKAFYKDHLVNTKKNIDLAIYLGKDAKSEVGVLIEAKRPSNTSQFIKTDNFNRKAFQELLLYYLRERVTGGNNNIKHLIITNGYEWFFFKGEDFYEYFYKNKKLVKEFIEFEGHKKDSSKNELFYNEIAPKYIEEVQAQLPFLYINIKDVEELLPLENTNDKKLISLYKVFSPTHLLGQSFGNDSNQLNKQFYYELLHIIGLEETKEKGKKIIQRKAKGKRNFGSLLESAIFILDDRDYLRKVDNLSTYGKNREEQLFSVGLELCLTWINRILFLKLLESQLLAYHKGEQHYKFLNNQFVKGFDDLEELFFSALAKRPNERNERIQEKYQYIPYLNSSLFEPSELEDQALQISNVKDADLELYDKTILKDAKSKRQTGKINNLDYLFGFLDAYDFSSEGTENVDESNENKSLINASVLGLIFEKINGYKDGSFYTPAYITMYMSRETLRRAVVQKFNTQYNWTCKKFEDLKDDLKDHIRSGDRAAIRKEANKLVNSLKICDPAVGSGHFLVSCLNELIVIKSDLGILIDKKGKRLNTYIHLENDELIIEDENEELFEYKPNNSSSQRIQETLFHEKQTLIENCLFGVDLNPNSVKICRLRLWIELLKNAYYTDKKELQTLPNIDINIKTGNSLISRFALDDDLKKAFKSKQNPYSLKDYKKAVQDYKQTNDKTRKREVLQIIDTVKTAFKATIDTRLRDRVVDAQKTVNTLEETQKNLTLFGEKIKKVEKDKLKAAKKLLTKRLAEKEEIEDNVIYQNAFEWRFEFPEVLDSKGAYLGFDVVIGNPPYMRVQAIQKTQPKAKEYYEDVYEVAKGSYDLANVFFEKAVDISNENAANAYIFPHKFFNSASTAVFRDYLTKGQYIDRITHFGANMIFDEADTYTCIAEFSAKANEGFYCYKTAFKDDFAKKMMKVDNYGFTTYQDLKRLSSLYGSNQWILLGNSITANLFEKIYLNSKRLAEVFNLMVGVQTSKDELYIGELIEEKTSSYILNFKKIAAQFEVEKDYFKPILKGKDVQRYSDISTDLYVFFPYEFNLDGHSTVNLNTLKEENPLTYKYIIANEKMFKARESGKAGKKEYWYAHGRENNLDKFEQPKLSSMEICSKHPNVTLNPKAYHTTTVYSWIKHKEIKESYEYFLAIANSKLLWWFLLETGDTLQGDARRMKTNYLNPFPFPNEVSEKQESTIVERINKILALKKEDPKADTSDLEQQIDILVYKLYGLTYAEVQIVDKDFELSEQAYLDYTKG